ncbi:Hypothetical protein GLP15_3731 [Giardia lamblia P15]|uniref:DNA polymerase alpha subunit B n=1 Tax=Giardia intestinalis (strain P15) TaxID=658858 RepID=E1F259_GIAIA|nr:Hypothetical protein GLP15_3731 [Giardia lamblia P15]
MTIDFRTIRLQEDRTRGLRINELCTSALGSIVTDAIEDVENTEIILKSRYLQTPQMSTTYHTVFLSLLLKLRKGIRYIFNMFSSFRKETYLIGILLHTYDDSFMILQINTHGILDILLDEPAEPSAYAKYLAKLQNALLQIESFPMVKLTMMASHTNNISVLFLGALLGLEGLYYDQENFCVTSIVQYYSDAAIIQQNQVSSQDTGPLRVVMKEMNIQQTVAVSKSFRLLVLRGPFIKPRYSVKVAVDVIHKLVEKFEASVVLLTGPLLLEYPPDPTDYDNKEPHSLAQQYLLTFLLALHVSMLENRCHAILATDCNCLLAPDSYYPTMPHNTALPNNNSLYKTISFGGDPLCFSICGVNLAYFSSALLGFQFIESSYLSRHREASLSSPQPSHNKPTVSNPRSPECPFVSSLPATSQSSPFKRLTAPDSPSHDLPSSLPVLSKAPPTPTRSDEIADMPRVILPNENLLGLCDSLVEGRILAQSTDTGILKGLEQKRLLYYINASLELQTSIPEFPSSRPLLHSRTPNAWLNPETDIIITTLPAFSPPLLATIYGKPRVIVPLLEKDGQGAVITLRQGYGTIDNLAHCETYNFTINFAE